MNSVYYKNYLLEKQNPLNNGLFEFRGYYRNGEIRCIYTYKTDTTLSKKAEGLYREWCLDGSRWQCEYKEGKRDGKFEKWYETGKKYMEVEYKEGKVIGEIKKWNRKGELII
jgi:antitoxin component YwqK of YwqJK toxin-antitoxin module